MVKRIGRRTLALFAGKRLLGRGLVGSGGLFAIDELRGRGRSSRS